METDAKKYPNLETICRLCLKENTGTVGIFADEESSKFEVLSVPTRIMACAALEVQRSDAFPKKICIDCRLQLEKSYYFRKLCQQSDAKLRKHLRLIALGKTSKVFDVKLEDDDDDDEIEFQDSLNFIKEHEEKQKQTEKSKLEAFMKEIKTQNELDVQKIKENLRNTVSQELIPEIRETLREELQVEIKKELEENIRKEVTEQCIIQAKESLRLEVREECRQLEMKILLEDVQTYLNNKIRSIPSFEAINTVGYKRRLSRTDSETSPKIKCVEQTSPSKLKVVHMEVQLNRSDSKNDLSTANRIEDQTANDEESECESNFLIYNTEESFEVQKKCLDEEKIEYQQDEEYEEEIMDSNFAPYEKVSEDIIDINEDSGENTSTTSYRIEDNNDGEIKLLKKSNDDGNTDLHEENVDRKNDYKDIMVINISDDIKNEYVDLLREEEKKSANSKQRTAVTRNKKLGNKSSRAKSTVSETKFLTNSYVNPMQRVTDTPKIFKCGDCPMVFSTKHSLERHLNTHRKLEKTGVTYQCPECYVVVSCSSALRRHMYVHCEEKPFSCDMCSKSFVQKEILKRHMQTHTGIKPHACPHCDRSFAQRINLNQHIQQKHTEEPQIQQHACCLCPKRFNHASGLSRHMVTHSGVAFQCSECDRTFGDRSSIKRHIANMHSTAWSSKTVENTENS